MSTLAEVLRSGWWVLRAECPQAVWQRAWLPARLFPQPQEAVQLLQDR